MIPSASIVTVYHFHTQKLGPQSSISFFLLSNIKEHRGAKGGGRYGDFFRNQQILLDLSGSLFFNHQLLQS